MTTSEELFIEKYIDEPLQSEARKDLYDLQLNWHEQGKNMLDLKTRLWLEKRPLCRVRNDYKKHVLNEKEEKQ